MTTLAQLWLHVDPLVQWVYLRATEHGYVSLVALAGLEGVGLPVPAELIVLALTVLVRRHDVALWPAIGLTSAAYTLGCMAPYALGRWGGAKAAARFIPPAGPRRQRLEAWINGYGVLTLIVTRFVGLFRLATIVIVGALRMPLSVAVPALFGGAAMWLYFGYHVVHFASAGARQLAAHDRSGWWDIGLLLVVFAIGAAIVTGLRRRTRGPKPPRSRR